MSHKLNPKHRALFLAISALFFLPAAGSATSEWAGILYDEGDWRGARREALREMLAAPDDDVAAMIHALASLRLDPENADAAQTARRLITDSGAENVRARMAYEMGRIRWAQGDLEKAYAFLKTAFGFSDDYERFLMTAYSLDVLLFRHPELAPAADPVRAQVRTARPLITIAARQAAAPPPHVQPSLSSKLAMGPVRLYQTQIGPAIGQRCSMYPSCSSFCMEASRTHGLLAVPMTADRLIRETDHVNHRINPIIMDGVEKYHDPVSDHTFWFRRERR